MPPAANPVAVPPPASTTGHGPPKVTFVGHATVLVEVGGLRILTDPLLTGRVSFIRRVADPVPAGTAHGLDLVLVSHLHHDHLHLPSLRQVGRSTPVLVPRGGGPVVRRGGFDHIVEVVAGDRHHLGPVAITVVPARHTDQRQPLSRRRAEPVGYVIECGGWSCYFAGDTDLYDDMGELTGTVDLALLPVWGWGPTVGPGHLDPSSAAAAVDLIRPGAVVPIHWGTLWPLGLGRFRADRLVAPPRELIDSLDDRGVTTDVHLLPPGGALDLADPEVSGRAVTTGVGGTVVPVAPLVGPGPARQGAPATRPRSVA